MVFNIEEAVIEKIFLHHIGNKSAGESYYISKEETLVEAPILLLLKEYFLRAFKSEEQYHFKHDFDLNQNEVYSLVKKSFENPDSLAENSANLALHLYNKSDHPKIKAGEFYVVYFSGLWVNGETCDAIGLFKSENKDTFLEVELKHQQFDISSREGININKLDKGCLILNTHQEEGYLLSIVDNTNKSMEAQYWKDDFLNILIHNNSYHQTQQFLTLTKQFVTEHLPQEFEMNTTDKIDLLNRSVDYFKKQEHFEQEEFEELVFTNEEVIHSFRKFNENYQDEYAMEIAPQFDISPQAVKRQSRVFKSIIKLDKNFHIYIHGNKDLIEQGVDENGRKYYKIYYEEET